MSRTIRRRTWGLCVYCQSARTRERGEFGPYRGKPLCARCEYEIQPASARAARAEREALGEP